MTTPPVKNQCANVGLMLSEMAQTRTDQLAVAHAQRDRNGRRIYEKITFRELDQATDRIALGLQKSGMPAGARIALLVPPGVNFIKLVFAMFKSGVVTILIDPGMGRKNMISCLQEAHPEGFVAISKAHAVRSIMRFKFPKAKHNVTIGKRWFWGGKKLSDFDNLNHLDFRPPPSKSIDPAAIIFTTGSTGPPKGVLYEHGNFAKQVTEIRDFYNIEPGGTDLSGFPLFALFNCAMGVTTIVPEMDATRPANVDPTNIIEAVNDFQANQSFASPALWNTVAKHCEKNKIVLPSLRKVLTAGAPVPPHVLKRLKAMIHPDGEIHTPYGATEALPVASNSASTVINETAEKTHSGKGTCVGKHFTGIEWKIIEISDEPISDIYQLQDVAIGEIGELLVRGPVVTREYVTRTEANAIHKVLDGDTFWHRMGDVGYLDEQDRFWFCGRKGHRVITERGPMFTIPCEAIFNCHPSIYRSALVGIGEKENQTPVMIVEPWPEHFPNSPDAKRTLIEQLKELGSANELTADIQRILIHKSMPVDIRHNAKIFREKLAQWAASKSK